MKRYIKLYKGAAQEHYFDRETIMTVDIQSISEIEDIADSIVEIPKTIWKVLDELSLRD